MGYITDMRKSDIEKITVDTFKEAIFLAYRDGITSVAPLGMSGEHVLIYGEPRKGQVSIRNYCGNAELLITDLDGNFLFYGRYDADMGLEFIADQYFQIFAHCKKHIDSVIDSVSEFKEIRFNKDVTKTAGFAMLAAYQSRSL